MYILLFHTNIFFKMALCSQKAILKKIKCLNQVLHENFDSHNSTKSQEKWPDFYTWFKYVAKHIEGCLKVLLLYLDGSQIWLNLSVDCCHDGYITKFTIITLLHSTYLPIIFIHATCPQSTFSNSTENFCEGSWVFHLLGLGFTRSKDLLKGGTLEYLGQVYIK